MKSSKEKVGVIINLSLCLDECWNADKSILDQIHCRLKSKEKRYTFKPTSELIDLEDIHLFLSQKIEEKKKQLNQIRSDLPFFFAKNHKCLFVLMPEVFITY